MIIYKGVGVSNGIAIGTFHYLKKEAYALPQYEVSDTQAELQRFYKACEKADIWLQELYERSVAHVGEAQSFIFLVHKMMLADEDFIALVSREICKKRHNAEWAVHDAAHQLARQIAQTHDSYLCERAADVEDAAGRLLDVFAGRTSQRHEIHTPVILGAVDLLPSETVQMDRSLLLGFATVKGSQTSHTAILARMMGVPGTVQISGDLAACDGKQAILDGNAGILYIEPDAQTRQALFAAHQAELAHKKALAGLVGKPSVTQDGHAVQLFANIGGVEDLPAVLENDAEGIGLFRSEFLYLGRAKAPTEEEQFAAYSAAARAMCGKLCIIRTMDIGADKRAEYLPTLQEENPALGLRAIRLQLTYPDLLRVQLRAVYRASAHGKLALLLPMITSLDEIRRVRAMCTSVQQELRAEGYAFDAALQIGVMIETPAAVMISDVLAEEADFFSVGTNDLTQYLLAVDRQNGGLDPFYAPHHAAVLRSIAMTTRNAHRAGKWVGICGELAADTSLTETFLDMGVDELSVAPAMLLPLREKVRSIVCVRNTMPGTF